MEDGDLEARANSISWLDRQSASAIQSVPVTKAPGAVYSLAWEGPVAGKETSMSVRPFAAGPTEGQPVSGAVLASRGFWMPRMRPETVTLVHLQRFV